MQAVSKSKNLVDEIKAEVSVEYGRTGISVPPLAFSLVNL